VVKENGDKVNSDDEQSSIDEDSDDKEHKSAEKTKNYSDKKKSRLRAC
jgi:hypothetical protein